MDITVDVGGTTFDFQNEGAHILLAVGDLDETGSLTHHCHRISTKEKVKVSVFEPHIYWDAGPEECPVGEDTDPEGEGESEGNFDAVYEGCNEDKGCFGAKFPLNPDKNCVKDGNCQIMVSYKKVGKEFDVSLHGIKVTANNYFAVAISTDDKMGDDLVFSCFAGSSSTVKASWNTVSKSNENIDGGMLSSAGTVYKSDVRIELVFWSNVNVHICIAVIVCLICL